MYVCPHIRQRYSRIQFSDLAYIPDIIIVRIGVGVI
ncbi:hypothetical protein F3J22_17930 [Chitinophaga sp. Cy-1792]|nr:hypothetical protein [Chitinophaga sp. Cy-1792]